MYTIGQKIRVVASFRFPLFNGMEGKVISVDTVDGNGFYQVIFASGPPYRMLQSEIKAA